MSSSSKDLIVSHHPLSVITESYRTIRTALQFSRPEIPPQVILLTSPSPGEGKTVTTLNLAITLARDGHRVLIIDADLRKGSCHTRLGIKNHRGLSNILTGNLSLEEGIRETFVRGLSLLSHGNCPPNPSNLLASRKMRETLNSVRESFDFVLIDSPPVIAVSDAAVLAMICDGVFLVFNGRQTTLDWARKAMEHLNAVRAPVLGVILNGVDLNNPDYAYYRSYYGSDDALREYEPENSTEKPVNIVADNEHSEIEPQIVDQDQAAPYGFNLGEAGEESGNFAEESSPTGARQEQEGQRHESSSQDSFKRINSNVTGASAPLTPVIIKDQIATLRDQIAALSEFRKTLPKIQLKQLLSKVFTKPPEVTLTQDSQCSVQEQVKPNPDMDVSSEAKMSPGAPGPENVTREFLDYMTFKLTEAVGPMAPVIMRDQIRGLGESSETFPKARLTDLLELIYAEIVNESLRSNFRQDILLKIRSLQDFSSTEN
jgi:capsular exopolysaccharide synthesis family protein